MKEQGVARGVLYRTGRCETPDKGVPDAGRKGFERHRGCEGTGGSGP